MFNQNVFDISSEDRSIYTYKSVNRVKVYGRHVTLDFHNKPGPVDASKAYVHLLYNTATDITMFP